MFESHHQGIRFTRNAHFQRVNKLQLSESMDGNFSSRLFRELQRVATNPAV